MSARAAQQLPRQGAHEDAAPRGGRPRARATGSHTTKTRRGVLPKRSASPLVVKPPAGAGAQATFRVDDREAFGEALRLRRLAAQPVLIEEFITGEEHSLETISIGGRAVWHSLTHYYPTPLDVIAQQLDSVVRRAARGRLTGRSTRTSAGRPAHARSKRSAWTRGSATWSGSGAGMGASPSPKSARGPLARRSPRSSRARTT